ncbi:MAG: hypothetical protein KDB24_04900 [Microthrixaceae bacterium]|nr:hypothetical protein [Microthrixaceae bacterium]
MLAGGWVLIFGAHLLLSARIPAPTVVFDEIGYLGNARALAGGAGWQMPFAPFYSAGYSVLLAPAFAVVGSASGQWMVVRLVNAALLACLFPGLAVTLRRLLSAPARIAVAGAFVGALAPAALASGQSAIAENLVLPMVPVALLAAQAAADTARPVWQRVLAGPAVVVLLAAHPRFSAVAVLSLVALGWAGLRGHLDRRVAAINSVLLVAGVAAVTTLNRALIDRRWDGVERMEGGPSTWLDLVTSPSGLRNLIATAVGQAWYLAVGSAGLALVGAALVARRAGGRERPAVPGDVRGVLLAFLGAAAVVFATSVVFFAQNQFRADHYVYGRHNDSFTPVWIAVAVAAILDVVRFPRLVRVMGASVVTTGLLGVAIIALRDPSVLGDRFAPFAVPAITRFIGDQPESLFGRATLVATATGLAISALVVAVRRSPAGRPRRAVAGIGWGALVAGALALGATPNTADFARDVYAEWHPVATITRLGIDELCIDGTAVEGRANLSYGWALPNVEIRSYDAATEEPECEFSIARLTDPARRAAGDRVAVLDQGAFYPFEGSPDGLALWVRTGPAQQRLDARGALLPAGFPAALPDAARSVRMVPVDRPEVLRVAPGGRVHTSVLVQHTGADAPWPDLASYEPEDRVRVLARVTPTEPGGPGGAATGGELPHWMLPGDTAVVDVELVAIDTTLAPLRPGRYTVQLGVEQVGRTWFATGGPRNRFILEVTG